MKSLEVTAPEGYEIDAVNSSIYKIVFKELKKDVLERINCVQDAIDDLGKDDEDVQQLKLLRTYDGISKKIIAEQELVVMFKACNEGWVGDLEDGSQPKYFIWWKKVNGETQFSFVYYFDSYAHASLRLCTKSTEIAKHLSKIGLKQFQEYI